MLGKGTTKAKHKAVRMVLTPLENSPLTVTSEKEAIHSVIVLLRGWGAGVIDGSSCLSISQCKLSKSNQ